jgi:DNA-binding cell septation regulator SpoVG
MSAPIQVIKVKALESGGNLKAFVDVRIGAVVIRGCRVVQQPGQKAWVSMPQTKSGEKYYAVVEIESEGLRNRVREVVLEHWESVQDFRDHPGDTL